ncbi:AMP-dependent synthetase/ligase [Ornithinibacillus halotolerans]|uniref:AMP-dependent synthetase n=1 Tax=Ornithinibacillus halotolerans TaxID=1274357 RepID=A0A916W4C1_9BACI|nr:long-chain fatty acid--CoA ligase [Ornithinibacillus halotolerans]GGA66478.1 AMP-dependent synthetase [Ornithinibacillus halotolerans]
MKPSNLVDMLYQTVTKYPEKDVYMWKENGKYQHMTFRMFWEKIYHAASAFKALGIEPGDKVAILSNSNPKWGITDFSLASIGAVSVPVYPTLPADQIAYILENSEARAIVVEDEEQRQKVIDSGVQLDFKVIMYPGEESSGNDVLAFENFERIGKESLLSNWEDIWSNVKKEDLVTIIYTSGTTGKPKGTMLTHENFLANIQSVKFWFIELLPEDLALSYLPLSHVFERMAGHYTLLSIGTTIAYAESIETIQENLVEVKPTIITTVPRLLEKVYAKVLGEINGGSPVKKKIFNWALDIGAERYDNYLKASVQDIALGDFMSKSLARKWKLADRLVYKKVKEKLGGRLRGLVSGGGTLNPDIARFFWSLDMPILEGYGLTETAPVITLNPMVRSKVGTVGKVLPNLEVKLAEDGEVLVKGPSVMNGYFKNEQATAEAFEGDWFKTGDIGAWDEEGYLKIIDRKKRILVLSTGKNVAPQPIESAINESPFIEQSLVVGDNKKFITCLINPDYENLLPWAKKNNVQSEDLEEICRYKVVRDLLEKEVLTRTDKFANYEQPKKIVIISEPWTIDGGELTPKMSLRINVIQEKYKDLIENIYEEAESGNKEVVIGQ